MSRLWHFTKTALKNIMKVCYNLKGGRQKIKLIILWTPKNTVPWERGVGDAGKRVSIS